MQSQTHYQTIVENSSIVLFAVDRNGILTFTQGAGLKNLNSSSGANVGKSAFELYKNSPDVINSLRRALNGESFTTVVQVSDLFLEVNYNAIYDVNGEVTSVFGVSMDITERVIAERKSEEAIRRLETLVEREAVVHRITNTVRQSLKIEEVFRAIVNELGKHLAVDRCILYLFDHDRDQARAAAGYSNAVEDFVTDEFNFPLPLAKTTVETLLKEDFIAFEDVSKAPLIEPLYEKVLKLRAVKSLMCVAIRVGDELTGVISFTTTAGQRSWSADDVALARAVAVQAGIAIRQAELYQQAEAASQRESLINRLGTAIRSTLQLSDIFQTATHELGKVLEASRVFIRLYDAAQPEATVAAQYAYLSPDFSELIPLPSSYAVSPVGRYILRNRKPFIAHNTTSFTCENAETSEYVRKNIAEQNIFSAVYFPILIKDRFLGALCIEQAERARKWTENDLALIEAVADQLSLGIAQAELFEFMRRAKHEWETTFDAMSDGVFIFNCERHLVRVNRAGAAFEGTEPKFLINKKCCEILTSEQHTENCVIQQVVEKKRPITVERPSRASRRPLLITAEPLIDDKGDLLGAVSTVRDLHDLREAQLLAREQEMLLARVLEGVLEPIFAIDLNGRLLWCNRSTTIAYGYAAEKIARKQFLEMIHPADYDEATKALGAALAGEPQNFEARFLNNTGDVRHAIFNSVPLVADEKISGALWYLRDITDQKRVLEQALQADKLRALGQLASGVAHDFNNSLTAILGRVQLLHERAVEANVKHDLQVIRTAAEDAAATVRRIQTFARQTPTHDFATVDVAALMYDSVEMMRTRWENEARSRGVLYAVEAVADGEFYTLGNASELREVFINLIGNSLDAMPQGGRLQISCTRADNRIYLNVADTGAGMSREVCERIFEPFFSTKGVNGTGLGLSVSYSIIEAHGGHISVASTLGRGTTFTVELPLVEPLETPNFFAPIETLSIENKMSILVVDDENFVREALADMLTALEYDVATAKSGREALQKIEALQPDVVFTDLSMPEMDGWQLAREIRRQHENTKIVLVTGYGSGIQPNENGERNLVDSIIGKPFDFAKLTETLTKINN